MDTKINPKQRPKIKCEMDPILQSKYRYSKTTDRDSQKGITDFLLN